MSKPTKSVRISVLLEKINELSLERLQQIRDQLVANTQLRMENGHHAKPDLIAIPELDDVTTAFAKALSFSPLDIQTAFANHKIDFNGFDSEIFIKVIERFLPKDKSCYTSSTLKKLDLLNEIYDHSGAINGKHALEAENLYKALYAAREEMAEKAKKAAANASAMLARGNQEQTISAFIELGRILQNFYPGMRTEFIQKALPQILGDSDKKIALDARSFREFCYIKEAVFLAASDMVEEYGEDSEHTAIVTWLNKGLSCYDIVANVDLQADHEPEKTTIEEDEEIKKTKENILYIANLKVFKKSCEELMQHLHSFLSKEGVNIEDTEQLVTNCHLLARSASPVGSTEMVKNQPILITKDVKHAAASFCAVYHLRKELIAPNKSTEERLRNFCEVFRKPETQAELSTNPDVKVRGFYIKMSEWVKDLLYKLLPSKVAKCISAFWKRNKVRTFIEQAGATLQKLPSEILLPLPTVSAQPAGAPCAPIESSINRSIHSSRSPSPTR